MATGNKTQRPHVLLSVAMSMDGFIDDAGPDRLLLSNRADFDRVDAVRAGADAVLLGAGALRSDNPRVVVRSDDRRAARVARGRSEHPTKVTITASGQLDPGLQWFHTGGHRVVYTTEVGAKTLAAAARVNGLALEDLAEVVTVGLEIDLRSVLADLADRGVATLMVEGGEQLNTSLLAAGLVDEVHLAIAPLLVGAGPRFVGQGQYPWPPTTRWALLEHRPIEDMVLLRYSLAEPSDVDLRWLRRAIALAGSCPPAAGAFSVGACIVDADGVELAAGYSRESDGHVHAEESALSKLDRSQSLAGATLYSSLEPCAARASRPTPCAQLIIERGIRRVVMAWREPPDFVAAPDGVAVLRSAGVEVVELAVPDRPNFRP